MFPLHQGNVARMIRKLRILNEITIANDVYNLHEGKEMKMIFQIINILKKKNSLNLLHLMDNKAEFSLGDTFQSSFMYYDNVIKFFMSLCSVWKLLHAKFN